MAKAINWNNFNQGFNEAFLTTYENAQKMKEEREMFNQRMEADRRQFDLQYKIMQDQESRMKDQENRLTNQFKLDVSTNYLPSEQGKPGAMLGKDIEKTYNMDIYPTSEEEKYYSPFKEVLPEPKELYQDKITKMGPDGKPHIYAINKYDFTEYDMGIDYQALTGRINATKSDNKGYDIPTLNDKYEKDALGRLLNPFDPDKVQIPENIKNSKNPIERSDWMKEVGAYSNPDLDFSTVLQSQIGETNPDMAMRIQSVINSLGGYPDSQTLINHLQQSYGDEIDEQDKVLIGTFLTTYDKFQPNLRQPNYSNNYPLVSPRR